MTTRRCLHCAIRELIEEHARDHNPPGPKGEVAVDAGQALWALAEVSADFVALPSDRETQTEAFDYLMKALSCAVTHRGLPTELDLAVERPDDPAPGLH